MHATFPSVGIFFVGGINTGIERKTFILPVERFSYHSGFVEIKLLFQGMLGVVWQRTFYFMKENCLSYKRRFSSSICLN